MYVCVYVFIALTLEHKSSDVNDDESFEMFYQKYKDQVITLPLIPRQVVYCFMF